MNETIKTILNRRSIREYKLEQIKEEELNIILEAGRFAPSGMNRQPWHFTVIQNPEMLKKINELCKTIFREIVGGDMAKRAMSEDFSVLYNAPTLIIVSGDEKVFTAQYDCTLAMGNMFIAAASLGIGSCWIHVVVKDLFNTDEGKNLRKELNIPEGFIPYASGIFGYKAAEPPARSPRKEGTVSIIK